MNEQPSPNTTPATSANSLRTAPPSNAPTIFLLLLVLAAFVFVGWWAFWGKGARATANAVLPPQPSASPSLAPRPQTVGSEQNL